MEKKSITIPCCPPNMASVEWLPTIQGIKALRNTFVYVTNINTVFFVDNQRRITTICAMPVQVSNYNPETNLLNLRSQFAFDNITNTIYFFSPDGTYVSVGSAISMADLDALKDTLTAEIEANSSAIANLNSTTNSIQTALNNEIAARENEDSMLSQQIAANYQLLNSDIMKLENTSVQRDTTISGGTSTVTLTKTVGNLEDEGEATALPLPVASETQAGVMNTATYTAVQENSENIDSILVGAVALTGLPDSPTQEELTDQWKNATGKTGLINRASIYDVTGQKIWNYYSNTGTWYSAGAGQGSTVTVNQATNESLGIVKGSTNPGQNFVEADGTLSVNGWDDTQENITNLQSSVSSHTQSISSLQTSISAIEDEIGQAVAALTALDTGAGVA